MEKIVCRFCMMDGRTSAFYVDAATTGFSFFFSCTQFALRSVVNDTWFVRCAVSDVLASMCERIRITNSHGWSLLVTYNDHTCMCP
jgi:hypothetical protein